MGVAVPQFIKGGAINGIRSVEDLLQGMARTQLVRAGENLERKVGYKETGKDMSDELVQMAEEFNQYAVETAQDKGMAALKSIPNVLKGTSLMAKKAREEGIDNMTTGMAINTLLRKDNGELSKWKVGGVVAGAYMGANIVGHGSLGIPFISSASWNR